MVNMDRLSICSSCLVIFQYVTEIVHVRPPRWPSGRASASRAEDPGFESRLRWDFSRVESYQ